MAKRFVATELWEEDWFLDMPAEYKLFWFYLLSNCDHAGLFKVNLRSFCGLNEVKVTPKEILKFFNAGKSRIRVISDTLWLVEDFFVFQYGGHFNPNNRVHESIGNLYVKNNIELTSIRGLIDLKDRVKDKDKDKDKYLGESENPLNEKFNQNQQSEKNGKSGKHFKNFGAQGEEILLDRFAKSKLKVDRGRTDDHQQAASK